MRVMKTALLRVSAMIVGLDGVDTEERAETLRRISEELAEGATRLVPGPIGVPWGDPNSPGSLDAPPIVNAQPVPEKVYTVGEVNAPVILHRIEPVYPAAFVKVKLPGKVAVRCIIDKNGHVRDAQVVFATNQAFADSVLRAIAQWRYKPASLNGQAVDCYLDLKVDFGVR